MIALNTSVASLVPFPIYGEPITVTFGDMTFTYPNVEGYEPGQHLLVQSEVVDAFPTLEAFVFTPENPPQDPGPNGVWLRASTLEAFIVAAPPAPIPFTLFFDMPE